MNVKRLSYRLPLQLERVVLLQRTLHHLPHRTQELSILLEECINSLLSTSKHSFLPPGLESFNHLARIRRNRSHLFYLGLSILFWSLFVFLFWLLHRLHHISKLLFPEIKNSAVHSLPLLLQISFTVGINANPLLLHQHQPLSIKMHLLLCIIYIKQ